MQRPTAGSEGASTLLPEEHEQHVRAPRPANTATVGAAVRPLVAEVARLVAHLGLRRGASALGAPCSLRLERAEPPSNHRTNSLEALPLPRLLARVTNGSERAEIRGKQRRTECPRGDGPRRKSLKFTSAGRAARAAPTKRG